jgi:predicted GNAT family acetyltransferase
MSQEKNKKTVFRRIRGRIIPISISITGAGMALDAARTKRVYNTGGITIDKKTHAFQPFAGATLGDHLIIKKDGKFAGHARTYINDGTEHSFSWLGIKKKFRGQGLSNILAKQAAVEAKDKGGKTFFNHVVHPNSANLFGKDSVNKYYVERIRKGEQIFERISKPKAMSRVKTWHSKGFAKNAIFRQTVIPKTLKRSITPFRTIGNKMKIGLGIGLFITGASMLFKKGDK